MMDDLASADFSAAQPQAEAIDAGFTPLLTNYVLDRGSLAPPGDIAVQTVPIRQDRPIGAEIPTSLFMVYLKFDEANKLIARQLRFNDFAAGPNGYTLDRAEELLLEEARANPPGPHYETSNFANMVWKRPYYLTFVIDNEGWEFYWNDSRLHEAMRLLQQKDVPGSFTTYQGENYTFFEAAPDIQLASLGDAFRVMNCYRDANGTIEGPVAKQKYCFEIYLQAPFKDQAGSHLTLLIDPDGQNQGPRT